MENSFSLMGKTTRRTSNNFTIIKSITIIFMYVSRIKKNLSYFFFTLTHTLIISFKGDNTLLSHFYFLFHAQLSFLAALSFLFCGNPCCCYPPSSVPPKRNSFSFSLLVSRSIFPLPHSENPWVKAKVEAYKFFVTLSIYKTLFLFPFKLGIHYFFNKE